MAEKSTYSKEDVDECVQDYNKRDLRYDQRSRALRRLEAIAGITITGRIDLGAPPRPDTVPEMDRVR